MLAKDAFAMLKYEPQDFYHPGKVVEEFMTCDEELLAKLSTPFGSASLYVTGNCSFHYNGELFETDEDLDNRPEVIKAMRKFEVDYNESPWFFVQIHDDRGYYKDSNDVQLSQTPTELGLKCLLLHQLGDSLKSDIDAFKSTEQKAFEKVLAGFDTYSMHLFSFVRLESIERLVDEGLMEQPELMNALSCIQMESDWDEQDRKCFTFFYHTISEEAKADVRELLAVRGTILTEW